MEEEIINRVCDEIQSNNTNHKHNCLVQWWERQLPLDYKVHVLVEVVPYELHVFCAICELVCLIEKRRGKTGASRKDRSLHVAEL